MAPSDSDPAFDATIGGDTLVSSLPAPPTAPRRQRATLSGYQLGAVLGRGGMGEVILARDEAIGRDVAIKQLRHVDPNPDIIARFLREARIQARLEHPSIVPVHQVGTDEEGKPYFTMKRLTGTTLEQLLAATPALPLARLLGIFGDVCQGIGLAHSRGVVHRDVKPSNIMVGDFGEVYVLDWGLARALSDDEALRWVGVDVESLDGTTQTGTMLGTPGYMAPEQIEDASKVGTPADVYALGSILFEILTGELLHVRGAVIASTVRGELAGPAARRPDRQVPPELDALCLATLDSDPAKRPTVKELAERIRGFVEGDRDLEQRRTLARVKLAEARAALASSEVAQRADAMRAAGYALVLDPTCEEAANIINAIMFEPPPTLPPDLADELGASELAAQRRQGRVALGSFVAVITFIGLSMIAGVTNWPFVIGLLGYTVVLAAAAYHITRRPSTAARMWLLAFGNAVLLAGMCRLFGSLLLMPAAACVMAISLTSYTHLIKHKWLVIALLLVAWLAPALLEAAGALAPTWSLDGATLSLHSPTVTLGGKHTVVVLFGSNLLVITVAGLFASALATSRKQAMRQVEIQAWHLRQLLPKQR